MPLPRLISAVPTPLDGALRVAIDPLSQYCQRLLESGCDGIVLFGTTGEGTFFSPTEKLDSLRRLIAAGLAPHRLILATGACALDDAATMVKGARDAGCVASLVLPPFFTKQIDDDGLLDWFEALLARTGRDASVLLYHIPAVAGVGFGADLASQLYVRHGNAIRGVKDSSADSGLARALLQRSLPGIYVSTEVGLAGNLEAGMQGTISASLNVTLPLVREALAGSAPDAEARITAIRAHLVRHSLIWAVKTALFAQTGDSVWLQLAPPHRAIAGLAREPFLGHLRALQTAGAE